MPSYYGYGYGFRWWPPYVPVAERRRRAARKMKELEKKGRVLKPVVIEGRRIAATFWGEAWCDNLESYSDFENRLPRGRTYVRNGSVIDLQIEPGLVTALVAGTEVYEVAVKIKPAPRKLWRAITAECAGQIDSVVELLEGRISRMVMAILARRGGGLFPEPREMAFDCSCPDWALMCKHVCAALYGVGARLDEEPELLFRLRQVDHTELIAAAGRGVVGAEAAGDAKVLETGDLAEIFDIDLDDTPPVKRRKERKKRKNPRVRGAPKPADRRARATGRRKERRRKSLSKRKSARPQPEAEAPGRKGAAEPAPGVSLRRIRKGTRLTAADLLALGVPRTTFQNWPGAGVLERTAERGVYRATRKTRPFIERALARRAGR